MARLVLLLLCTLLLAASVTGSQLRIYQGRVVFSGSGIGTNVFPVNRVATVELGATNQPNYYFDCNTTANDGAGIQWTKLNGQHRFNILNPPLGNGKRLNAADIGYPDLDVYFCTDTATGDVVSLNITADNPAIMAEDVMLGVVKGHTVEFRIYASSYPLISSTHVHWYRPGGSEILENEASFHESRTVMILSNVQPEEAGTYECEIDIPLVLGASLTGATTIDLDVYVASSIEQQPQNMTNVLEFSDITLTCSATGNPLPMITWEREGDFPLPLSVQVDEHTENGSLVVSELSFGGIRHGDAGRYRCVAVNDHTPSNSSLYAEVSVTPALRLTVAINGTPSTFNNLIAIQEGSRLSVECLGSGTLQWTASLNSLQISSDSSNVLYQVYDVSQGIQTLNIQTFNTSLSSIYTCTSSLGVQRSVFVTSSNPAVFISTKVQYVLPTNSTTLVATVYAFPQEDATIEWYHKSRLINTNTEEQYSVSVDGNSYMLHVMNVDVSLLGEYEIVVTLQGQNSTDYVNLTYPNPPTASVTPSEIAVSEGDQVRFQCQEGGSGSLAVTWSLEGGRGLPVGVSQNGSDLVINSVLSTHRGSYVCSVTNVAGTQSDSAVLTVFYRPTAAVHFGELSSTSSQRLYLSLTDGQSGPTFSCTADGHLPPNIQWFPVSGSTLPNGISQESTDGGRELRWQRPLEYTDSGEYECRATNNNGASTATLEILVKADPVINSIYPTVPVRPSDTINYLVPNGYVGVALTCNAFGWPPPAVEWLMNEQPLPTGVISVATPNSAIISASLRWTRGFQSTDIGVYRCVVRESNMTTETVASQTVLIQEGTDETPPPPPSCSIDDSSTTLYFQIRVLDTDCTMWDSSLRQHIANGFRDELLSIVETECSCGAIQASAIQILDPECSEVKDRAVVFRGLITTDSASMSEDIFCALSTWQQSGSLVTINNAALHSVDSQCSLQLQSISGSECEGSTPTTSPIQGNLIIYIVAGGVGLVLLLSLLCIVICCVSCYCRRHREELRRRDKEDDTYARTHDPAVLTKYGRGGRHSVGPASESPTTTEIPLYSTLENIPPPRGTPLPPPPPFNPSPDHGIHIHSRSLSQDHLIGSDIPDGEGFMRRVDSPAESYQISIGDSSNVRMSTDSVKFYKTPYFPEGSEHSSSRLTSPTQKTHPSSRSSSNGSTTVVSATNPLVSPYEQIDHEYVPYPSSYDRSTRKFSYGSSVPEPSGMIPARKYSEGGSSFVGSPPLLPPSSAAAGAVLTSSDMFVVREEEEKMSRSVSSASTRGTHETNRTNSSMSNSTRGYSRSRSTSSTSPPLMGNGGSFNLPHTHSQSVTKVPLQHQQSASSRVLEGQVMSPRDSHCSEGPPPYSSRPPSSSNMTTSASSMVGNGAYEISELAEPDINGQQEAGNGQPWYKTESDFSLDSNSRRDFQNPAETIPPYAMIHNSAIPHNNCSTNSFASNVPMPVGCSAGDLELLPPPPPMPVSGGGGFGDTTKRPVLFAIQRRTSRENDRARAQPYSEPISSSIDTLASYGRAQESNNFEMVTV